MESQCPANYDYKKYKGIICHLAWKWHLKTGMEYEELLAEGNLVFVQACQTHKYNAFTTYLYTMLQWHYGNMVQTKMKTINYDFALDGSEEGNPERQTIIHDRIDHLPEDAKDMVQAVLETPAELADMMIKHGKTKMTQKVLHQYFREVKGWTIYRIWSTLSVVQKLMCDLGLRNKAESRAKYLQA